MRKKHLINMKCPNFGTSDFRIYGVKVDRDGAVVSNIAHDQVNDNDDVKEGVVVDFSQGTAYPISGYVLSMLSDEDADQRHYNSLLGAVAQHCTPDYAEVIEKNLSRLAKSHVSKDGVWNLEEMAYYDKEVDTEEDRRAFLEKIRTEPLWHIYLERGQHLIHRAELNEKSRVLEIGCGNARTIAWVAPPKEIGYEYIGLDISWKRLLLAKLVIPEGDFVQASALRVPFFNNSFSTLIAFGSLHHLPDPEKGLLETLRVLQPNGHVLIHEPIEKPSLLPEKKFKWIRQLLMDYEHSEHDNEISLEDFKNIIHNEGLAIEHCYFSTSVVRTLFTVGPMSRMSKSSYKFWWKMIVGLDKLFIALVGRKPKAVGPGAVAFVLRKPKETTNVRY